VAMTNAEKQAAWRRRRDARTAQLQAELEQLRNQSKPADREQQLRAQRTNARPGDELSTARKLIEEMLARPNLDAKGNRLAKVALAEITKVQTSYVTGLRRIDAKIAELAEVVPDVKLDARRRKIQARIDRGSTEGERAAARHLLTKLPDHEPERLAPAPEPLPRTREEMLARRNTRNGK
jgi:hypothetical protein